MARGNHIKRRTILAFACASLIFAYSNNLFSEDQSASYSTPEDQKFDILVPVNSKLLESPAHGLLADSEAKPGYKTYTPFKDFFGVDQFVMRSIRPDGKDGERTIIRIQVSPVNDPPVAADHVTSVTENEPASIQLSAFDVDRDPLTFTILDQPKFGTLSGEAPKLTYRPLKDQKLKEDQFSYLVSDGHSNSRIAFVTILKGSQRFGMTKDASEEGEQAPGGELDIQINGTTRIASGENLVLSLLVNSKSGVSDLRVMASDISGYEFNILGKNNNAAEFKWQAPLKSGQKEYFVSFSASNVEGQNRVKRVDIHIEGGIVHDGSEYSKGSDKKKDADSGALQSYGDASGVTGTQSGDTLSGTSGYLFGPYGAGLSYSGSNNSNNSNSPDNGNDDDQEPPPPSGNDNQAPAVNAGADQEIQLPTNQFTLSGSVSDDGLPSGITSVAWTQVSGPAQAAILNLTSLTTGVTVNESGDYVFRLTATDQVLSASDEVLVRVVASGDNNSTNKSLPIADAGSDQEWTLAENSNAMNVTLDGSRSFDADGTVARFEWSGSPDPEDVIAPVVSLSEGVHVFSLSVTDNDNLHSSPDEMVVTIHPFSRQNQAPTANAGADQQITLPTNQVHLTGSATDDGLPSGTLTVQWTKVDGPGDVVFENAASADTQALFSLAGVYHLKLTASDTALESSDEAMVTVQDEPTQNNPPVVNAGPDQQITLPVNEALLAGTATDDGLPNGTLNVIWEKISGPGNVQFSNRNDLNSSAVFDQAGIYVLRLTADDTAASAFDEMQVVVYQDECNDPHNDQYYLLKPSDGFSIEVSQNSQGKQTFRALWNQEELRSIYPDETFFIDRSGGLLDTTYEIIPKCGGVDIVYQLNNTTNNSLLLPHLKVDGIQQNTGGDFYLLDLIDYGNIRRVNKADGSLFDRYLGDGENWPSILNSEPFYWPYPRSLYSPTILTHDTHFAVGVSLQYPYLNYKHDTYLAVDRITEGLQQGTWRYQFYKFSDQTCNTPNYNDWYLTRIAPGEQRTYTLSVRFTVPDKWVTALYPYKVYFQNLYGNNSDKRSKDRRPIFGKDTSYCDWQNLDVQNPRCFDGTYRVDLNGWADLPNGSEGFVSTVLRRMNENGYERSLIWAPAGRYDLRELSWFNQPPQFMDWLQPMIATAGEFQRFSDNGFKLGFYWGRPTEIPVFGNDPYWNAVDYENANPDNPAHVTFLTNQLALASQRGAKEIGLDYFFCMPLYQRYEWIDQMKTIANENGTPDMNFCHEGAGPDLMHSKISNLYWPEKWSSFRQFSKAIEGPDVLSWYLNPHSEIWAWYRQAVHPTFETVQNLTRWGYTPLILVFENDDIDIRTLNYTLPACYDDIDQDGDGFASWPYDPECSDLTDNDETA